MAKKKWIGGAEIRKLIRESGDSQIKFCSDNDLVAGSFRNFLSSGVASHRVRQILALRLGVSEEQLKNWGARFILGKSRSPSQDFSLNGEELTLLLEAQKVLGDLSWKMIFEVVMDHRKKKKLK